MWIKAPERWKAVSPVYDDAPGEFEYVEFNESGSANVAESVGEYLINKYDEINEYEETE